MFRNIIISFVFLFTALCSTSLFSQSNELEFSPETEKAYTPFMYWRHGGIEGVNEFKKAQPHQYLKELWYYSRSFYVKRNFLSTGVSMNETYVDISRYEISRKESEEVILELPGFRDVLVLLPANQLIYKP